MLAKGWRKVGERLAKGWREVDSENLRGILKSEIVIMKDKAMVGETCKFAIYNEEGRAKPIGGEQLDVIFSPRMKRRL
jgi:hypothetical protein